MTYSPSEGEFYILKRPDGTFKIGLSEDSERRVKELEADD